MIGLRIGKDMQRGCYPSGDYEELRNSLFSFLAAEGTAMSAAARKRIWEITDVLAETDAYHAFFATFGESITVASGGYSVTVNLINL